MLTLKPLILTTTGQCTGFTVEDTTDYNQLPNPSYGGFLNIFSIANFEAGIRIIKVTIPDGTINYYTCNNQGGVISSPISGQFLLLLDTRINASNNTTYNTSFYTTVQGNYTVSVISIPSFTLVTSGFVQTNASAGDVFSLTIGSVLFLGKALVNNPTNNVNDHTQWIQIFNESDIPSNYFATGIIAQDCSLTNLACVFDHVECAFCCGCCDDIADNQNAIRILKASMMTLELNLLVSTNIQSQLSQNAIFQAATSPVNFIPDDSYLNKACEYYKSILKLCKCNQLLPCSPCDKTSEGQPDQPVTYVNINTALSNIFSDNFVNKLNNQVMLGKKISHMDRKTFIELVAAIVISNQYISISAPNYNCLNIQLGFDTGLSSVPALINNEGVGIAWQDDSGRPNFPKVITYNI